MSDTRDQSHGRNAARSAARLGAVQALYQMDVAGTPLDDVVEEFAQYRLGQEVEGDQYPPADDAHFSDILSGVVREQRSIDVQINEALADGWVLARIDTTLRAVLRAGTHELQHCPTVPARVVVSEYVNIAHAFFQGDEPRVVNAVLDRIGRQLRSGELA